VGGKKVYFPAMMTPDQVLQLVDRVRLAFRRDPDIELLCNELMRRVLAVRPTITAMRPWEGLNISRTTWYRRRAAE
jgi:hypothetical protein